MPTPCSICLRPDRAELDRQLATEQVNLARLARTLGVGRKALERHRDHHTPTQLADIHAYAHADNSPSAFRAELEHRYKLILHALAAAQSATLARVDRQPSTRPTVSNAAIAVLITDARYNVGLLAELFLSAEAAGQVAEPLPPWIEAALARMKANMLALEQTG
jgi:hypothetical protein